MLEKEKHETELVLQLEKEEQLNDNDYNEVQNSIEKVHPDLFKRLKELSKTKLSNLDLKYQILISYPRRTIINLDGF